MYIGYYREDDMGVVRYRVRRSVKAYVLAAMLILCAAAAAVLLLLRPWRGGNANGGVPDNPNVTASVTEAESRDEAPPESAGDTDGSESFNGMSMEAEAELVDISCGAEALRSGQPLVLIIHTHTSEAYRESDESGRSENPEINVIALGTEFAKVLAENGICAIHCSVVFDEPTLLGSFKRAAEVIREYKRDYPTLSYVVDLHRLPTDANGSAGSLRAVASLSDLCPDSIPIAMEFTKKAGSANPNLLLPVYASDSMFNHDLCAELGMHPLTLEIGHMTDGIASARAYADISAGVFAELIIGNSILAQAEPLNERDGDEN